MDTTFVEFQFTTDIHEYPRQVYSKIKFIVFTLRRHTFIGGKTNISVLPTLVLLSRDILKKSVLQNTKNFFPFCLRTIKKRFQISFPYKSFQNDKQGIHGAGSIVCHKLYQSCLDFRQLSLFLFLRGYKPQELILEKKVFKTSYVEIFFWGGIYSEDPEIKCQ